MKQPLPFDARPYPPIEDYALISDCESTALVGGSNKGLLIRCSHPLELSRKDTALHAQVRLCAGKTPALGVYQRAYGQARPDASLLLLPHFGYLAYDDPRMLRTTDWICRELEFGGLLRRYDCADGLPDREGVFLPCTFRLVECLARRGRLDMAWRSYRHAVQCANELGLFSEEMLHDGSSGMLGNFPQSLTHLSQVTARLALDGGGHAAGDRAERSLQA